jgi:hypothetical protein
MIQLSQHLEMRVALLHEYRYSQNIHAMRFFVSAGGKRTNVSTAYHITYSILLQNAKRIDSVANVQSYHPSGVQQLH